MGPREPNQRSCTPAYYGYRDFLQFGSRIELRLKALNSDKRTQMADARSGTLTRNQVFRPGAAITHVWLWMSIVMR